MLQNSIKKVYAVLLVSFVFMAAAAADTSALTERFLDKANDAYSAGKYAEAYKNVNRALQLNKNGEIPDSVILMAQTVYVKQLETAKKESDYDTVNEIMNQIVQYPQLANTQINMLIRQIQGQQEKELQLAADQKADEQHQETLRMHEEDLTARKQEQDRLLEKLDTSIGSLGTGLSKTADQNRASFRVIMISIFIITGVLLLIFLVVMVIIQMAMRASKRQHEQFEATLRMVASMQNATNSNLLRLGGVTDLYGGKMKSAGSSRWGMDALPEPEQTEEEKHEIQELAVKCEDLGTQIDQVTGRKNNSKNVSELVYKLAVKLGVQQHRATVYFCAAMVYDAGFLDLDEELLRSETLTEAEKEKLRTHVDLSDKYLQFVPKGYWDIFKDAATKHHANMDGSGYPEGLSGDHIPEVARLIRVAETYISLSSVRNYRAITDKETAIRALKQKPEIYDADVVAVLDEIV